MESIDMINEYLMKGDNADIIDLDFNKEFDISHSHLLVKMKNKKEIFFDRNIKVKLFWNTKYTIQCSSEIRTGTFVVHKWFVYWYKIRNKTIADDVKLLSSSLSKETTPMDLNKLSYWKNIWKLKFSIEKCKVQQIWSKNIKSW